MKDSGGIDLILGRAGGCVCVCVCGKEGIVREGFVGFLGQVR